jgi:hypothetical protein
MSMEIREIVQFYLSEGLNVIPIKFREKTPLVEWSRYQKERPIEGDIKKWFSGEVGINIAIVCGRISGNLIVVDFDDPKAYKKLFSGIDRETLVVQTSRGLHVYFKTDYPINTFKVDIPRFGRIDVKGEGGYVLAPPSIHPSGKAYEFVSQIPIKHWDGDFKFEFLEMVRRIFKIQVKQEKINITKLLQGVPEGQRDEAAIRVATWFRKEGLSEDETLSKLREWNQRNQPPLEDEILEIKIKSAFKPEEPYGYDFEETKEELFTEEEIAEAKALLDKPEILWLVHEANQDIVREDKNKVLIPVLEFGKQSFEVTGESASGKNTLVDRCLQCVPSQWYDKITGLSDKAIRYMPSDLRTLYIAERKGLHTGEESTAEYDVKVGISEGKIEIRVVTKNERGEFVLQRKTTVIDNFILTSTEIAPPPELENRIYNLCSDESVKQNELVRDRQLENAAKLPSQRLDTSKEKKILRAMFHTLDKEAPENFVIPYASLLNTLLPATDVSIRRHTPKLINLIGSIARIYYRQLPIVEDNGKKVIVATPEIFWLAWRIGDEAITGAVAGLTERQMRLWKEVLQLFNTNTRIESKILAEAIGKSTNTALNWLRFFEQKGLLVSEFEGRQRFFEKHFEDTAVSTLAALSFAELEKETQRFLETYSITPQQNYKAFELTDPLSGKRISKDFLVESSFALEATGGSEKQREQTAKVKTAVSSQPELTEWKDVLKPKGGGLA